MEINNAKKNYKCMKVNSDEFTNFIKNVEKLYINC
jgi:hypothetical protein